MLRSRLILVKYTLGVSGNYQPSLRGDSLLHRQQLIPSPFGLILFENIDGGNCNHFEIYES